MFGASVLCVYVHTATEVLREYRHVSSIQHVHEVCHPYSKGQPRAVYQLATT